MEPTSQFVWREGQRTSLPCPFDDSKCAGDSHPKGYIPCCINECSLFLSGTSVPSVPPRIIPTLLLGYSILVKDRAWPHVYTSPRCNRESVEQKNSVPGLLPSCFLGLNRWCVGLIGCDRNRCPTPQVCWPLRVTLFEGQSSTKTPFRRSEKDLRHLSLTQALGSWTEVCNLNRK